MKKVTPAVVKIDVTVPVDQSDDDDGMTATSLRSKLKHAIGSGVILDSSGYIMTNAHVVKDASKIMVTLDKSARTVSDQALPDTIPGRVVGRFEEADLVLLKVDAQGLHTISLRPQDDLRQGQVILAIGSPEGLQNTVSLGVVSSAARQVSPDGHVSYIQMDAAVNPGSSGGPLVDIDGRLVGINSFFLTEGGGNEGLGFAVPSRIVEFAYRSILRDGKVLWGDAGVRVQGITRSLAEGLRLPHESGVVVADVIPETSAEAHGLKVLDVISALDGKSVENVSQYFEIMYHKKPADTVVFTVIRNSQVLNFPIELATPDDKHQSAASAQRPTIDLISRLGVLCSEMSSHSRVELDSFRSRSGVLVEARAVNDDSQSPLSPGDVIRSVNLAPVSSTGDLQSTLDHIKPGNPIVLQIERKSEFLFLSMEPQ